MDEMSLAALQRFLPSNQQQWLDALRKFPQPLPPDMRDRNERLPRPNIGYDRNAVQGDDLMRQYFWPQASSEKI